MDKGILKLYNFPSSGAMNYITNSFLNVIFYNLLLYIFAKNNIQI